MHAAHGELAVGSVVGAEAAVGDAGVFFAIEGLFGALARSAARRMEFQHSDQRRPRPKTPSSWRLAAAPRRCSAAHPLLFRNWTFRNRSGSSAGRAAGVDIHFGGMDGEFD